MNRRNLIAAAGVFLAAPSAALARGRDVTIPYTPKDTRPYYDPIYELKAKHVDPLIWPAVRRINQSGWVWTAESCQGHERGWSHYPELRLVCRVENIERLFRELVLSVPVGQQMMQFTRYARPPKGWFELQVWAIGGLEVFERFANRVNH